MCSTSGDNTITITAPAAAASGVNPLAPPTDNESTEANNS